MLPILDHVLFAELFKLAMLVSHKMCVYTDEISVHLQYLYNSLQDVE